MLLDDVLKGSLIYYFMRRAVAFLLLLLGIYFAWKIFISVNYSITKYYVMDDAFITFKYARNLIEQQSLVWNVGDQFPTEGYTSIIWVLILSVFYSIGADIFVASKFLSVLLMASVPAMIFYYFRTKIFSGWFNFFALMCIPFLFFSNPDVILHLQSGMETALAVALTTAFFIMATKISIDFSGGTPSIGRLFATSTIGLLCALNRPEFNLVFVATFLTIFMQHRNYMLHIFNWLMMPYLCAGFFYMLWRTCFYGLLFPLPFYIKTSAGFLAGVPDVISFILTAWPLVLSIVAAILLRRTRRVLLPIIFGVSALCLFFMFPAHIMGDAHRFLFPLYGALVFLFFFMLIESNLSGLNFGLRSIVLAGVIAVIYSVSMIGNQAVVSSMVWYAQGINGAHIKLGKALSDFDGTIAVGDAGAVPYYSNWHAIDTYDLNDKPIALARYNDFFKSYDVNIVLSRNPDLIVLISSACGMVLSPKSLEHEAVIFAEALSRGYSGVGSVKFQDGYYLYLIGKNTELVNRVKNKLIENGLLEDCILRRTSD